MMIILSRGKMTLFYIKYAFYYKYKQINSQESKVIYRLFYNLGQNNAYSVKKMVYCHCILRGIYEKRAQKATETISKKKTEESPEEKPAEKPEEKKETEEKKASVIETGKELEKAAAKKMKHETKLSKQPKRQRRRALQK